MVDENLINDPIIELTTILLQSISKRKERKKKVKSSDKVLVSNCIRLQTTTLFFFVV